ncbi:DUF4209 domain-containing protein [Pontibacter akesuensis]|uniref:DUF4209 domain-containing protein n=1 Tax=Pontibacter akesuensis TaxID=388950 RepID=A0A1I7KR52_9BACT|nr:DUF4209 domain-containing protein [Pontibacter akesuensis]GHA81179.1 hypothetical protein GCM10007389_39540 [Pontibacter akesuensis]SFU99932.1 protein of unknown function [Pontibacter akesuensis]
MAIDEIPVTDGLYDDQLIKYLWAKRRDSEFDTQILDVLEKLCKPRVGDLGDSAANLSFSDSEVEMLKETNIVEVCKNKEIVARWCDYVQAIDRTNRPKYVKEASRNYLEIYKATGNCEYLVRKLQLVRKYKALYRDELEPLFEHVKEEISKKGAPYWQLRLIKESSSIFTPERCQAEFLTSLEEKVDLYEREGDYGNSRFCIDSLHVVRALDVNQWRVRRAENYEKEGDRVIDNRLPNTLYPSLDQIFYKGLQEIKSVENSDALRERLEEKLEKAQLEKHTVIQIAGIPTVPPVDHERIKGEVAKLGTDSFEAGFKQLLSIPIVSKREVEEYVEIRKSQGLLTTKYLSETVKVSNKGAAIGSAKGDDALANEARFWYRERRISVIVAIKQVMDVHRQLNMNFVFAMVEGSKSRFITKDRADIYSMGLLEGFNNNYISAAHLLMPQLEHSLRHIATQYGIVMTNYAEDLQHEKTLGVCLGKMKDAITEDLQEELKNFLTEASSVNFRNNLCHGLIPPSEIAHYGIYLWWLALKLIFQTEHFFPQNDRKG